MSLVSKLLVASFLVAFLQITAHLYGEMRDRNTVPTEHRSKTDAVEMFHQAQQRVSTSDGDVLVFDGRSLEILFVHRDPAHIQDRQFQNLPVPERWFIYSKAANGRFVSYTLSSDSGKGHFRFIPKTELKSLAADLGKMDVHAALGGQVLRVGALR